MNKKAGQKRSPVSWLMELAAPRRWEYLFSVPFPAVRRKPPTTEWSLRL